MTDVAAVRGGGDRDAQGVFECEGHGQGLTLAHFRAQLEDLRDTSLTSELNLSTFGTHPWVNLGHIGDKGSSS
jgi:hypothetical protein